MEVLGVLILGILWVGIGVIVVLTILKLWCKLYKRLMNGK